MAINISAMDVRAVFEPLLGARFVASTPLCQETADCLRLYAPSMMTLENMFTRVREVIFGEMYAALGQGMLLTLENGRCTVEERRVRYDVEALIAEVKRSGMYAEMPVWCEILFRGWRMCREHTMFFLRYAEAYARKIGDARRPFMPDTWNAAYAAWINEPDLWAMVEDGDFPR